MDPCLGYVNVYIWTPTCHVIKVVMYNVIFNTVPEAGRGGSY